MVAAAGVDASLMKGLLQEDGYVKKIADVKSKISSSHPDLLPLVQMMEKTILETFDQYEGIRQIADLRGIPELGEKLFQQGFHFILVF